jgi:hypothetical protein
MIETNLNLKTFKWAVLRKPMMGKFTSWKKGERVKAHRFPRTRTFWIEKAKSKRPFLPLREQLTGVPKKALAFDTCMHGVGYDRFCGKCDEAMHATNKMPGKVRRG